MREKTEYLEKIMNDVGKQPTAEEFRQQRKFLPEVWHGNIEEHVLFWAQTRAWELGAKMVIDDRGLLIVMQRDLIYTRGWQIEEWECFDQLNVTIDHDRKEDEYSTLRFKLEEKTLAAVRKLLDHVASARRHATVPCSRLMAYPWLDTEHSQKLEEEFVLEQLKVLFVELTDYSLCYNELGVVLLDEQMDILRRESRKNGLGVSLRWVTEHLQSGLKRKGAIEVSRFVELLRPVFAYYGYQLILNGDQLTLRRITMDSPCSKGTVLDLELSVLEILQNYVLNSSLV